MSPNACYLPFQLISKTSLPVSLKGCGGLPLPVFAAGTITSLCPYEGQSPSFLSLCSLGQEHPPSFLHMHISYPKAGRALSV